MRKFAVVSGFLGSGKTSTMIALSKHWEKSGIKASLITNDLGAKNLIDYKFTKISGCNATEMAGECICYQTENLVDRLHRLFDFQKNEIVLSDIPGCGVGALDHVYHTLQRDYPGEFDLAPFLVVTDPERLQTLLPNRRDIHLPREMERLFQYQLKEADIVVLNKVDTISETQKRELMRFLSETCSETVLLAISAKTGEGIPELAQALTDGKSAMKQVEIPWDYLDEAERKLCWYDRQFYAKVCCQDFDANAFLEDIARGIAERLEAEDRNIPHLKLYGQAQDGSVVKLSLTGRDAPVVFDRKLPGNVEDIPVLINARAACESAVFSEIVDEVLEKLAEKYQLDVFIFFTECFGMMDEGRM